MTGEPLAASEIRSVTVGVTDLDRAADFYCRVFDYRVRADGRLDGTAWHGENAPGGRYVVVGPQDARSGLVTLASWDGPRTAIWRDGERQHLGHYALNFRVRSIDVVRDRLQASSERTVSEPRQWSITPEITVWDSLSTDPDGTVLDVFEVTDDATGSTPPWRGVLPMQTVAVHVPVADVAAGLYRALGYRVWFDKTVEGMADFFHLRTGGSLRDVNLYAPGGIDVGRFEIVEYVDVPGERQDERARPGGVGIVSATVEVAELAAASRAVSTSGGTVVGPVTEVDAPMLGRRRVQIVRGTGGEALELVEGSGA